MLGFLPWEKWLPPYIFGPVLCGGSACVLVFCHGLHWWEILTLGIGVIWGAVGTLIWLLTGQNTFDISDPKA
jgi:hypothetical protein